MNRLMSTFALALLAWTNVTSQWNEKGILIWAEYRPGGTCDHCFAWRVTIFDDGFVAFESKKDWDTSDEWMTIHSSDFDAEPLLSKRQVQRLARKITKSGWSELNPKYSASYPINDDTWHMVTDRETVVIKARVGSELKRVEIYGPIEVAGLEGAKPAHPDKEAGRRFCSVFAVVLDLVGSPNLWQRPGLYR